MLWADRSTISAKIIERQLNDFVTEKEIEYEVIHTMIGLNDRIIVRPITINRDNLEGSYWAISLILSWAFADADMAVMMYSNKDDTMTRILTSDFLDYINEKAIVHPERWEIAKPIQTGKVKYFPAEFDDPKTLNQIVSDMKICIQKISAI